MLFAQPSILAVVAALAPVPSLANLSASGASCADEAVLDAGCDPSDRAACEARCGLHGSTYLLDKCCAHAGALAQVLAFEEAPEWVPRLAEYGRCTGASVRMKYVAGGEDAMAAALADDVGRNGDPAGGQGIYDAYIVQAPWLPPVFEGLKSLSPYIKENDDYIDFMDINPASRSAVSFEGEVRALPLDTDYIALGWRQDVFGNERIQREYRELWREPLTVPDTIEELVTVSERLNGRHDFNNDGVMDWGFCLTPQTNYFQAFLAPVLQTHLKECERTGEDGGYVCRGSDTGQNIHFDVDNLDALVDTEGYRYAVELYSRFVMASNCQDQIPNGEKCDRKTAFPTGRCAGVISMPGTMTQLLLEDGKYAPPPEKRLDGVLGPGEHWGRRKVFPGSRRVVDWDAPGRPLVDCAGDACPLARDGVNYAPFFAEGGESYALNGRQSKPAATEAVWDLFTWLSTLPAGQVPLSGVYRKSQLTDEATEQFAEQFNSTVMAQDLNDVLDEYFKSEEEGGNPVQDLFIVGFPEYNDALNTALHTDFILGDIEDGGLFNMDDTRNSIDPMRNKNEFDERYAKFATSLTQKYDDVHAMQDGGALRQLSLWRGALDISPAKSEEELCQDLLATDHAGFDKLDCIHAVILTDLCQSQEADVEEYLPGACSEDTKSAVIIAVLCGIVGAGVLFGLVYFVYIRYRSYRRIKQAHEQQMESIINESMRSVNNLDYPLHLIRGNEFVEQGRILRHEVLRNTHKLTVLDSLSDVDAFVAAGKHVIFFSHQWTSFTAPDPSGNQYRAMCHAAKDMAKQNGWDETLKDVFIWVDYSSIPQVNPAIQNLAVRSLAAYAASATYFVIVAPEALHADLDDVCDLDTYQKRMWCRAEQLCFSMRNGSERMYLAVDDTSPIERVESDFFHESLHVFDGELTCCRLEHKGMGACDRQSLVIPFLGLYGVLSRAAHEAKEGGEAALSSVNTFLGEIEKNQETIFPRTFQRTMWRNNKRVTEEIVLFGDLIERMKAKIISGADFNIEEDTGGTLSTKSESFLRHGASGFLRHGASNLTKVKVGVETAVKTIKT